MGTYTYIPSISGGTPVGGGSIWGAAQYALISSLMPTLTGYQHIKATESPIGSTALATNDGAIEGGGRSAANATVTYITGSVFQTANTGKGAFAVRVKFLAAGAGQSNYFGLINAAGTHDLIVGVFNSVGGGTDVYLLADATAGTTDNLGANDLGLHTYVVTFDATNIKVYLDGTLTATRAIGTNVADEPLFLMFYNTAAGETVWTECMYAYVSP